MPLITLTTDWGLKDPSIAALKGSILKECSTATLVDISHLISSHDIGEGAYIFKQAAFHFPPGTVHIIGIENNQVQLAPIIIIRHEKHHFIGADNGIFSMIFAEVPQEISRIKAPVQLRKTNTSVILSRTAAYLANGGDMYQVGEKIATYEERIYPRAVIKGDFVHATVIYIDQFGNAVLNLDTESFHKIGNGRPFSLLLKRYQIAQERLYMHYSEVADGDAISVANSGGMMEIAINNGNAAQMIGIKNGDVIRIEFHDRTNR